MRSRNDLNRLLILFSVTVLRQCCVDTQQQEGVGYDRNHHSPLVVDTPCGQKEIQGFNENEKEDQVASSTESPNEL